MKIYLMDAVVGDASTRAVTHKIIVAENEFEAIRLADYSADAIPNGPWMVRKIFSTFTNEPTLIDQYTTYKGE